MRLDSLVRGLEWLGFAGRRLPKLSGHRLRHRGPGYIRSGGFPETCLRLVLAVLMPAARVSIS